MTMTLEIPETFAAQIEREAQRRGTDAPAFLLEVARVAIEATPDNLTPEAAQRRGAGALARLKGRYPSARTVADFMAERSGEEGDK